MKAINFAKITLRCKTSSRGGGIEISLNSFGRKYHGHKMTAYQNYLGGGLLGRVCNDCTMDMDDKLEGVAEQLRKYFHELTNPEDGWESLSFEQNQLMAERGY